MSEEIEGIEGINVQLYWAIFEAWSAQVDSYWQRTNYFAAIETAAIAGAWEVLHDSHVAALSLLGFGVVLTWFWIWSNVRTHQYVRYWWKALEEIESNWEKRQAPKFVSKYDDRRAELKRNRPEPWKDALTREDLCKLKNELGYSTFTNWVIPVFFLTAWAILTWIGCNTSFSH